jgi:hypothetical protein
MQIVTNQGTHTFQWDNTPWRVDQGGTGRTSFPNGSVLFYFNGFSEDNAHFSWNSTTHVLNIDGDVNVTGCYRVNGSCISGGGGSQLGLYDANDTFLGPIIGTNAVGYNQQYVVGVPSLRGQLRFQVLQGQLANSADVDEFFDQLGCAGNSYVRIVQWQSPSIVTPADGFVYTVATTSANVTAMSSIGGTSGGVCETNEFTSDFYKLTQVSLPYDPNNVALPFSIH